MQFEVAASLNELSSSSSSQESDRSKGFSAAGRLESAPDKFIEEEIPPASILKLHHLDYRADQEQELAFEYKSESSNEMDASFILEQSITKQKVKEI